MDATEAANLLKEQIDVRMMKKDILDIVKKAYVGWSQDNESINESEVVELLIQHRNLLIEQRFIEYLNNKDKKHE